MTKKASANPQRTAAVGAFRILQAGDQALSVEFGTTVDEGINRLAQAFDRRLAEAAIEGVLEAVPTYRSVLVLYDPLRIRAADLRKRLAKLVPRRVDQNAPARCWTIPVAYGGAYGIDLEAVAARHGLTVEAAAALHASAEYRVYMIGFAPGFAYLGGLPEALHTPRLEAPRLAVPAGSVAIGGVQAAIMSVSIPSGWHLLGRTPEKLFDPRRAQPFLLAAGDRVRFDPVSFEDYARLEARVAQGEVVARLEAAV